jgi:hypothetical protein
MSKTQSVPKTRDEIDTLILQLYPGVEKRKEDIQGTPADMKNDLFESVYTSTHKYDCLIHAFLICVSEPFRKLNQDEKDAFADQFRRILLPQLIDDEDMKTLLKEEYVFLSENVLETLERLYKINIVNFYKQIKSNGSATYVTFPYASEFQRAPFIFLYNPDNAHFRATRTHTHGHSYKFSYTLGKDLHESYIMDTGSDEVITKPICAVKDGDKVMYKGQEYTVEDRRWSDDKKIDPPICVSIKLKGRDEYVPIAEITKVTPGGHRRRNRNRKTRKANRRTKRQTRNRKA